MDFLKSYLLTTFAVIEKGTLPMKLGASLLFVTWVSPLAWIWHGLRVHIISDTSFVKALALCLFVDLFCGVWKHWKQHTFDWKRLYVGFIEKCGMSFLGMIVFNSITGLQEWEHAATIRDYLILVGKLTCLIYVAGSAFSSMYIITGGKFPPVGWMRRMKNFNETLDVDEFKKNTPEDKK